MRKISGRVSIVVLSLWGSFALGTQDKTTSPISSGSGLRLSFKSCLFEAEKSSGLTQEKAGPEILLLAKIYESSLGGASEQLQNLRKLFRLPELNLKEESPEVEVVWKFSREIYDEKRKMVGREEGKSRSKIRKTVFLDGEEYTIFLIPEEIKAKENIFKFGLEIYKTQNRGELAPLASLELITTKEILWNFQGPLAVGFFFDDKTCFLTFTIGVSISYFGGSLGSGLSWTL
jgi:hypothetical protein